MIPKIVPLVSMDLYLRRKYGVISGVIHDMRAGRWACITGLDQLLLYLDDVLRDYLPVGPVPSQYERESA